MQKKLYIKQVQTWPLYGCSRFAIQFTISKGTTIDSTLCVNKDGLHILELYAKNPIRSWTYSQISSWTPTKNAFTIVTGNLINPKREVFKTLDAEEIAYMYRTYTDALAVSQLLQSRSTVVTIIK